MAIGGSNGFYVHSDIDNWSKGNGIRKMPSLVETQRVDASIASLRAIREQLYNEANEFLAGDTAEFMNYCTDNEYSSYANIATQLLQDPDAISALLMGDTSVQMSKKNVEKLLSKVVPVEFSKQLLSYLDISELETVGARSVAIALADSISNAEMQLTVDGTAFIRDLYKGSKGLESNNGIDNRVLKDITGVAVNQLRSGAANARIVDAIETLIEKTNLYQESTKKSEAKDSVESFMNWFSPLFLNKAKQVVRFYNVDQTPEQYLDAFGKKIREKIKKSFKETNIMGAVGALGDEIIVSAWQADSRTAALGITIESIGTVKESDVVKKYGDIFTGVKQMVTHHEANKQSQTDILIKNKNGMVARVQAKNASLRNAKYSNNGLINLGAHLQRERQLALLLEALEVPNIEEIMYSVINAIWFGSHSSVSGKRSEGQLSYKESDVDTSILADLQKELSVYFSTKAENFIGITIDDAIENETKMISGASNIFYLKNGRFIPTYTLIDEVIDDLVQYQDNALTSLRGLEFSIQQKGIKWKYNNAVDFWTSKAQNDFANYLAVGTAQGAAAASSLIVTGNFNKVHELSSLVINTN